MFAKKSLLLSVLLAAGSASALANHDPRGPACLDRLEHEDYAAANTICARLADAGDAQGLFAMGRIYGESLGRKGDQVKSVELLTQSVAAGYTRRPPIIWALLTNMAGELSRTYPRR